MLSSLRTMVYNRLVAQLTAAGMSAVKVWQIERPQETGQSYVVFDVNLRLQGTGTAPTYDTAVEATCAAPSSAVCAQIAQVTQAALDDYCAANSNVRLLGLTVVSSEDGRAPDAEPALWLNTLRWQGLTIG